MINDKTKLKREFVGHCLLLLILSVIPFLGVTWLPSTDLPQHLALTEIFYDTFYNGSEIYEIQWAGGNNLVYFVMFALRHLFSSLTVGRIICILIIWASIAAIFLLAYERSRPVEHAILASFFVFNSSLYWGFLPFMSGWPVFALLIIVSTREHRNLRWSAKMLGLAALLFWAHSLWLLAGAGWLLTLALVQKSEGRKFFSNFAALLLPFLPVATYAFFWLRMIADFKANDRAAMHAQFLLTIVEKLNPILLSKYVSAPINGAYGYVVWFLLSFYVLSVIIRKWRTDASSFDKQLVAAACLGGLFYLFAPEMFLNTIVFSLRWLPYALILLVLSIPPAGVRPEFCRKLFLSLFAISILFQGYFWLKFEREEMTGLNDALAKIGKNQSVAYVGLIRDSSVSAFRPFLQIGAYATALHGSTTNFSFAWHANGIVRFLNFKNHNEQLLLPDERNFNESDRQRYDLVLVNASEDGHQEFSRQHGLISENKNTRFRLYPTRR